MDPSPCLIGMSLQTAADSDFAFCESLNRANMARYRTDRRIAWEPQRFREDWARFENLVIKRDGAPVGALRLLDLGDALEVRDLQVLPSQQRQCIGTWALDQARAIATARGIGLLKLRVYADNAALRLYQRAGFAVTGEVDGIVHMSLSLVPAATTGAG